MTLMKSKLIAAASLAILLVTIIGAGSLLIPGTPLQAQVGGTVAIYAPATQTASATCTTTACPTFVFGNGFCSGTVRVAGTNTALSIVAQGSTDGGTTYSAIAVGVVGAGITGNPGTLTTSIITEKGLYYINVPTMNRLRFIVNTLTGTNVTFKPVLTSSCVAVAP